MLSKIKDANNMTLYVNITVIMAIHGSQSIVLLDYFGFLKATFIMIRI